MTEARSLTNEQNWAAMGDRDRVAWFNLHGDRIAKARGAFVMAAEAYAREIEATGAADSLNFKADRFIESQLDSADYELAPEVRAYLGA